MAILGILAALLLTSVSNATAKAKRTICISNLKQLSLGLRTYIDEANDVAPRTPNSAEAPPLNKWTGYRRLMMSQVSQQTNLFACPADRFYFEWQNGKYHAQRACEQPGFSYSSYLFNGGNLNTNPSGGFFPGIAGLNLSSIRHPTRTVLIAEQPAWMPYSWHKPSQPPVISFKDAMNVVSFVDGHVDYIPIYWNAEKRAKVGDHLYPTAAAEYDPPERYNYQWSGE